MEAHGLEHRRFPGCARRNVRPGVVETLRHAAWINQEVKRLLPFGSPNQLIDFLGTRGENWARMKAGGCRYGFAAIESPQDDDAGAERKIEKILQFGAGNCGEHAAVTFRLLQAKASSEPILRVKAKKIDHAFVLIGDHRARSAKEIVVVDSWPTVPLAHTLDVGACDDIGQILQQHPPGCGIGEIDPVRSALLPRSEVRARQRAYAQIPEPGDRLIERAKRDPLSGQLYTQMLSTCMPDTVYFDASNPSNHFDADIIATWYADRKEAFLRNMDDYNKRNRPTSTVSATPPACSGQRPPRP